MWYMAKPEAMGALISTLFADRLFEYGLPYLRVGLMTVYVEEHVTAELVAMKRRPANEAIGVALGVVAKAWDEAMVVHGMFRWTIDECQRQVRLEVEEIVDEHISLLRQTTKAVEHSPHPHMKPEQTEADRHRLSHAQLRTSGADPAPGPP
jgi:hypothetical protein